MKLTRVPSKSRRHVQLELVGADRISPRCKLHGAVVKVLVRAAAGDDVDAQALRRAALAAGAAHVLPIVPTYARTERPAVALVAATDPIVALRQWAERYPPPDGCDPVHLLEEVLA